MKRTIATALACSTLTLLAACGETGSSAITTTPDGCTNEGAASKPLPKEPGAITIGSANFPESQLLADIYGAALETKGVEVDYHHNIGARAVYVAALKEGEIGLVPEYSGAILDYLDTGNAARTPEDVYKALFSEAQCEGLTVTRYAEAQDVDTVTVTKETAAKYNLESIADLAPVADKLTLGAPPAFRTSSYGTPALKDVYGVTFGRFVSLSPSGTITQTALLKGTVDAADIFSTDPSIAKHGFVTLADPEQIFAAENVVPLFRDDSVTQPMTDAADAVSENLTTAILAGLGAEVANGGDPRKVAEAWVDTLNLR